MLKLPDGRENLYQWDTNVKLLLKSDHNINEVHFTKRYSNKIYAVPVVITELENYVRIPNVLIEDSYDLVVYGFVYDENGNSTRYEQTFKIKPRLKPDGYVYSNDEAVYYKSLDERIAKLESAGGAKNVDSELSETSENPVQNKVITKKFSQLSVEITNLTNRLNNLVDAEEVAY